MLSSTTGHILPRHNWREATAESSSCQSLDEGLYSVVGRQVNPVVKKYIGAKAPARKRNVFFYYGVKSKHKKLYLESDI